MSKTSKGFNYLASYMIIVIMILRVLHIAKNISSMSKNTVFSWMSSNILNFLVKDQMNLSKWNKCILNLECITVTTLLLTYFKEKRFFWEHIFTIQRKFNSLAYRIQQYQSLFMPGAGIPWITLCLVFIKVYPSAWENALQIKSLTESLC